jgi:hypothetical protein
MRMKVHMALAVSGLVFAGGTALVGGTANAAIFTSHESVTVAPHGVTYSELSATNPDTLKPPKCRHVRGQWLPKGCKR